MKICIFGAGAVGGHIAAKLAADFPAVIAWASRDERDPLRIAE